MGRKGKYTKETKLKAIQEYINGSKSLSEISNELECHLETVREWVTMYRGCGETIFDDKKNNQSYSKEFKEQIVKEYLEGKGSLSDLRIKYNIFSDSTILNWISKYNNGIILTDYKPMSEVYTMKSRKTLYEERIEDIKEVCEIRIADVQRNCEIRIADMKQIFEERIKEQRELLKNN